MIHVHLDRFTAALGAALAFAVSPLAAQAGASSTFDTDADGWSAMGDYTGAPVTWLPTGGNPDGNIQIVDAVIGGVTYFVAPAKFLGNQSMSFGQTLSFDLKQHISGGPNPFDAADVILGGGGLTLVMSTAENPAFDAWTHYSVSLMAGDWHVGTLGGAVATDEQIQSALGSLNLLHIRAEYQTGPDTDYLDNVVLAAVPEPATVALMLGGVGLLVLRIRRDRMPREA